MKPKLHIRAAGIGEYFLIIAVTIAVCGLSAFLLSFNGLYGQDAHEYLRQSRVIFDRLNGMPSPPLQIGDGAFASFYPFLAALLRFIVNDSIGALQAVSFISAGVAGCIFLLLLRFLNPGAIHRNRIAFLCFGWALTPTAVKLALCSMSDMTGAALFLGALYGVLRYVERGKIVDLCMATLCGSFALITRYAFAAALLPLVPVVFRQWFYHRRSLHFILAAALVLPAFFLHDWLKQGQWATSAVHSIGTGWSVTNIFQVQFSGVNGLKINQLPNIFYIFFFLFHPAYCLLLPALYFLFKRTDIVLYPKRIILTCLAVYSLLLVGIPHQNIRFLFPSWLMILLLVYPAWDRFYAYGWLFFKRLTLSILAVLVFIQAIMIGKELYGPVVRSRLEQSIARDISPLVPNGATLYGFDMDIAMRTYLPGLKHINLWAAPLDRVEKPGYVIVNEKNLSAQWEGRLPSENWKFIRNNAQTEKLAEWREGWALYSLK